MTDQCSSNPSTSTRYWGSKQFFQRHQVVLAADLQPRYPNRAPAMILALILIACIFKLGAPFPDLFQELDFESLIDASDSVVGAHLNSVGSHLNNLYVATGTQVFVFRRLTGVAPTRFHNVAITMATAALFNVHLGPMGYKMVSLRSITSLGQFVAVSLVGSKNTVVTSGHRCFLAILTLDWLNYRFNVVQVIEGPTMPSQWGNRLSFVTTVTGETVLVGSDSVSIQSSSAEPVAGAFMYRQLAQSTFNSEPSSLFVVETTYNSPFRPHSYGGSGAIASGNYVLLPVTLLPAIAAATGQMLQFSINPFGGASYLDTLRLDPLATDFELQPNVFAITDGNWVAILARSFFKNTQSILFFSRSFVQSQSVYIHETHLDIDVGKLTELPVSMAFSKQEPNYFVLAFGNGTVTVFRLLSAGGYVFHRSVQVKYNQISSLVTDESTFFVTAATGTSIIRYCFENNCPSETATTTTAAVSSGMEPSSTETGFGHPDSSNSADSTTLAPIMAPSTATTPMELETVDNTVTTFLQENVVPLSVGGGSLIVGCTAFLLVWLRKKIVNASRQRQRQRTRATSVRGGTTTGSVRRAHGQFHRPSSQRRRTTQQEQSQRRLAIASLNTAAATASNNNNDYGNLELKDIYSDLVLSPRTSMSYVKPPPPVLRRSSSSTLRSSKHHSNHEYSTIISAINHQSSNDGDGYVLPPPPRKIYS